MLDNDEGTDVRDVGKNEDDLESNDGNGFGNADKTSVDNISDVSLEYQN